MPTLADVTKCAWGVIIWDDGTGFGTKDWRGISVPADFMSKAKRITERDLLPAARQRLAQEGNGARISNLWRIDGKIVATFEGND
jgi:hypothetical protein